MVQSTTSIQFVKKIVKKLVTTVDKRKMLCYTYRNSGVTWACCALFPLSFSYEREGERTKRAICTGKTPEFYGGFLQ
jgi:hypothetical protein